MMAVTYDVKTACVDCGDSDHYFSNRAYPPKMGTVIPNAYCWRCLGKKKVRGCLDMKSRAAVCRGES